MSQQPNLDSLMTSFGVAQRTREVLRARHGVIGPSIDLVLNGSATELDNDAALRNAVAGHWDELFSGRLDAAYRSSAEKLAIALDGAGIDRFRFAALSALLLAELTRPSESGGGLFARRQKGSSDNVSLARAMMFDVEVVGSSFPAHGEDLELQQRMDDVIQVLEEAVDNSISTVSQQAESLKGIARKMAVATANLSSSAAQIVDSSGRALDFVEGMSDASERLSSGADDIRRKVSESANVAQNAVSEAKQASEIMTGLSGAAQRINDVVTLINDIASQTNLLALNATIEAARAGDAGKGFAVVASEVKNLAGQTAKATDDVGTQANSIQNATDSAVTAIRRVDETIDRVNDIAMTVANAIEAQGATMHEIGHGARSAATEAADAGFHITTVSQKADDAARLAQEVSRIAETVSTQMSGMSEQLRAVIRNSRAGNRRRDRRSRITLPVTIEVAGQEPISTRLRDISLGGARVDRQLDLPSGGSVTVYLPAVGIDLTGKVLGNRSGNAHLQFNLSDPQRDRLGTYLEKDNGVVIS